MKVKLIIMLVFVLMFSGCATTYTQRKDESGYYVNRISGRGTTEEVKINIGLCGEKLEAVGPSMSDLTWNVKFQQSLGMFKPDDSIVETLLTYYPTSKSRYLEFIKSLSEYKIGSTIAITGLVAGGVVFFASRISGFSGANGYEAGMIVGPVLTCSSLVFGGIWDLIKGSETSEKFEKTIQSYNNNCGKYNKNQNILNLWVWTTRGLSVQSIL